MRWYVDRGALRADGTLRQSLTAGGSVEIREPYIATGSPYWALLAFGALWSLPDDDPFWTAEEEPLPVEIGDFTRVLPQPGWVVTGARATGAVTRYNARSQHNPAKYGKFVYATAAPFNVGLVDGQASPDGMLCLTADGEYGHRDATDAAAVGEPGWLRMRHTQTVAGAAHTIDTTIVVRGERHLRAHRVTLATGVRHTDRRGRGCGTARLRARRAADDRGRPRRRVGGGDRSGIRSVDRPTARLRWAAPRGCLARTR